MRDTGEALVASGVGMERMPSGRSRCQGALVDQHGRDRRRGYPPGQLSPALAISRDRGRTSLFPIDDNKDVTPYSMDISIDHY